MVQKKHLYKKQHGLLKLMKLKNALKITKKKERQKMHLESIMQNKKSRIWTRIYFVYCRIQKDMP